MSEAEHTCDNCRSRRDHVSPAACEGSSLNHCRSYRPIRDIDTAPEQIADLTAKLAAAFGALEKLRDYGIPRWPPDVFEIADKALADELPESKRLRAIQKAAENRAKACPYQFPLGPQCLVCDDRFICEAVR